MARDIELNVTASDKTGTALASAERRFKKTSENIKRDSDKMSDGIGKSLVQTIEGVAPKLGKSLATQIGAAGQASGPLLVAGIAAAAPFIGATLSGAVIGGAGIGGVVGGVLLAARDPRVQAAGKQLGTNMLASLQKDAAIFVQPVLSGIDQIGAKFDQLRPRIQSIFNKSSQFVQPLLTGALKAVDGISRGFESLVSHAGPVIAAISDSFGQLGNSVGDALEMIAGGAPEAAQAIRDLTTFLSGLIETTGVVIRGLTELYGVVSFIPKKLGEFGNGLKDLISPSNKVGTFVERVATNVGQAGEAATQAAGPITTFTEKVNNLATAGRGLFDSTTNVAEATDRFKEALKKNGKTLDENTDKGRANRTALSNLANALVTNYNAFVEVNGEGRKANQVAATNRASFIRLAESMGVGKSRARELATQMGLIPAKKKTDFYANTHDAEGRVNALKGSINSVKSRTITITIARRITGSRASDSAIDAALRKNFDATGSFAFAGGDAPSRTYQPRDVNVNSTVENRIYIDGSPFRDYVDRQVNSAVQRSAHRQKVGKR